MYQIQEHSNNEQWHAVKGCEAIEQLSDAREWIQHYRVTLGRNVRLVKMEVVDNYVLCDYCHQRFTHDNPNMGSAKDYHLACHLEGRPSTRPLQGIRWACTNTITKLAADRQIGETEPKTEV